MFEMKYSYTKAQAWEVGDHYLGLLRQLDKMKKGKMMKVKKLSETSGRWMFISIVMFALAVVALIDFIRKGEAYMLAFTAFLVLYGAGCISTRKKEKKMLMEYVPILEGTIVIDKKGLKEIRKGETAVEFTWKEFEFCIVTEELMAFFGKDKGVSYLAFDETYLKQFQAFLKEQKMDADYVVDVRKEAME